MRSQEVRDSKLKSMNQMMTSAGNEIFPQNSSLLTVVQTAEKLQVSKRAVSRIINDIAITHRWIGHDIYVAGSYAVNNIKNNW